MIIFSLKLFSVCISTPKFHHCPTIIGIIDLANGFVVMFLRSLRSFAGDRI